MHRLARQGGGPAEAAEKTRLDRLPKSAAKRALHNQLPTSP